MLKESVWERVEGAVQPWEAEVFFGNIERIRQYIDAEERLEIEEIHRDKILELGAFWPWFDAREMARGVATFYRFPGWELNTEDAD